MPTIAPPSTVVGAARAALPFGLFSVVTFRTGDRWESGVQFEAGTCDPVEGIGQVQCTPGAPGTPGTSEVQSLAIVGGPPTTGTFVLTVNGVASDPIPFNATAAQVNGALNNAPATAVASGGPLPASPIILTWAAKGDQPAATVSSSTLDAGAAGVSTTTPGVAPTPDGPGSITAPGLPKSLDANGGGIGEASPFTVYGYYACLSIGNWDTAQDLATAHLLGREEQRVEQAFWTGDLGNVPNLAGTNGADAPVVIDPAALAPDLALGSLESFIGATYGGQGVIHMGRTTASVLAGRDLLTTTGARLTTKLGTPVVAGGGYPGTGPNNSDIPEQTQLWAYATPALFAYRSEPFNSTARQGDLLNRANNELTAISERTYLVGFDPCGVGAVLIDLATAP